MRPILSSISFLGALVATANSSPLNHPRELLAFRAWDIRFFSEAQPVCNANASNTDLTLTHRYGASIRDCESLSEDGTNATLVKSISWKSPYRDEDDWYDLCMFRTADCSGGQSSFAGSITDGWEVCYPYNGFAGWTVVHHGTSCV
ncbi:hypothetical protein N7470_005185 [Penicillium chermesinum]|nr:hypothetical protein N7470_005185 [Penicillium chermesinum]